ncbi:tyrosine-type recombinase/integrase [Rhodoglobus aureus]|uniref:Tyr recombinase domain-containing protein n=1 Tax=Rhodoglobus aureus TaxID=191497 RepID=A0ABN1W1F5_9MICO
MMLPAPVNAPHAESTASIAGACAAHLARTHRGNTAYTQAAKTFLARFPGIQDWADRPLDERLSVNQSLRPFLTFPILTRRLQPGYDYLLARKFSSIWRDLGGTPLEDDLTRFVAAAREQGYSERVTSAMASQIVLRLLVGSGRPLNELTPRDFDDLALAGVAREQRTGARWRHYRDTMPATRQVLFHLGIVHDSASSTHRLPTTERLVTVPEPLRDALVRYLNRKSVTCVPGTITGLTIRLAHFGRIVTAVDPTLTSLAELDRCRHIEPYLITVSREVSSKTGLRFSKADQARRIHAISNFLSEITEWGWPDAPPRRLLFRSDIPRLPRPLPRYLPPDANRALAEQLTRSNNRLAADALLLQRACGLRIGELLDLELDCVHEVPGNGSWLKVPLGKFDTERMVPLDDDTLDLLDRISTTRSAGRPLLNPRTGRPADFLFTHHGRHLSQNAVRDELARAGEAAGLGKLTPHQLRHTYATALVNAGVSLQALIALLGHVSAQMSLRYGQLFDSTIRTEYERALDLAKAHIGPMNTSPTAGRTTLALVNISHGDWRETPTIKARMAGGYCLRAPAQKACPYANICEHCPSYRTDDTHTPVLTAQRADAQLLARDAEARGWTSEAERHRKLIDRLDTLISQAHTG